MIYPIGVLVLVLAIIWITLLWSNLNRNLSSVNESLAKLKAELDQIDVKWFAAFNSLREQIKDKENKK